MKPKKCFICKKEYADIFALSQHIENQHSDLIPHEWSGGKYYFYHLHNRVNGKCVVCGGKTDFNEKTFKPFRLCNNPNCKKKMRDDALNNHIKKYGKETLLNDPEFQTKMLHNRKITKEYIWSDGTKKTVVGSYEYDFAQFTDICLDMDSRDLLMPSPIIIGYEYDGNKHFYIPDAYIQSLNLLVEIKDGGNNPNMHPKIQAIDKVKERCKEEAIKKINRYSYIKICNKEYAEFVELLRYLKNVDYLPSSTKYKPVVVLDDIGKTLNEETLSIDNLLLEDNCNINIFKNNIVRFNTNEYGIMTNNGLFKYNSNDNILVLTNSDDINIDEIYNINNIDLFDLNYNNLLIYTRQPIPNYYDDDIPNKIKFAYNLYTDITNQYCNNIQNIDESFLDKIKMKVETRAFNISISPENLKLIIKNDYNNYHKLYQEAKQLLPVYIKYTNIESAKYELAKIHFIKCVCDKYLHNTKCKDKSKYITLKSFITPTFNKYIEELMKLDNTFNFNEYYNTTEFSTIKIDVDFKKGIIDNIFNR